MRYASPTGRLEAGAPSVVVVARTGHRGQFFFLKAVAPRSAFRSALSAIGSHHDKNRDRTVRSGSGLRVVLRGRGRHTPAGSPHPRKTRCCSDGAGSAIEALQRAVPPPLSAGMKEIGLGNTSDGLAVAEMWTANDDTRSFAGITRGRCPRRTWESGFPP